MATLLARRAPRPAPRHEADAAGAQAGEGTAVTLDEAASGAVFAALGVPVAPSRVVAAGEVPEDLDYPVAVKLLSAEVTHKTELGGVALGIVDADGVRAAMDAIAAAADRHGVAAGRFLVQAMRSGAGEAVLGYRRDPEVGPLVSVGAGGRLTEIYRDVAVRLAPVDLAEAREMLDEVRGFAPLRGYRGLPAGDLDALARALVAVSQLAGKGDVREAEINPLLVGPPGAGVWAVDAVVVRD